MVEIDEGGHGGARDDKLEEQGLIEYKMVFTLFCSLTHTSGKAGEEGAKITPGTYELNTDMGLPGPHLQHGLLLRQPHDHHRHHT